MSECQCNYIVKLLDQLKAGKYRYICVKEDVLGMYYHWIRKEMTNKVVDFKHSSDLCLRLCKYNAISYTGLEQLLFMV